MHELSLAAEMVRTVQSALARENGAELVSIRVEIGALSGVEREALEFCFPIAAEGTPLAGSRLIVDETPLSVRCAACLSESFPETPFVPCAVCGSADVEIVSGRDFVIKSLEVR